MLYWPYKWWGGGIGGGGWLIFNREGDRGWVLSCRFCFVLFFFTCAFVLFSLMSSVPFFNLLELGRCCVSFFVFYFFSLFLVHLSRSY